MSSQAAALSWSVYALFAAPLTALLTGFFLLRRLDPKRIHWPMLASCLLVTAASCSLAAQVLAGSLQEGLLYRWVGIHDFQLDFGVRIDGLSAPVLVMVTLVASLIHVYAVGYMRQDPGFSRFFLYFHFFFLMMIGLIVSRNYMQMYLFWEGVGLASYLLIGFWHEKPRARSAAWKAFLINRIGDIGFLMAILLMLQGAGSADFDAVFRYAANASRAWVALVAFLLFWAASAKSAQFPLYIWLPDAMEGPTPVSALMHAATMVAAGVFLMARSMPLLALSPEVLSWIAYIGVGTALLAALLASVQKDLKRILAYSTVSQLGLMMLAIGLGQAFAAVFHLITHGFFKALLFLCAGNVLHGLGQGVTSATISEVGGFSRPMRVTFSAFFAGALALSGFPPLAGFFSKDLILEAVFHSRSGFLQGAFLLTAAGSSFYIFRMLWLIFIGKRTHQTPPPYPHEPGWWMQAPVLILAVSCLALGFPGPREFFIRSLGQWTQSAAQHFSWEGVFLSLGVALSGVLGSYLVCVTWPNWDWDWRRARPDLERVLDADLGWQSAMERLARAFVRFARRIGLDWDVKVLDGFVESLSDSFVGLAEGLSGLSRGLLNEYLWWMVAGVAAFVFMFLCI